jgi:predicted ribonuclease toxin of YeeF-YezG toxin-antitoxin module
MRPKFINTESKEQFIKENYKKLSDKEISDEIEVPIPVIQRFRSMNNLYKNREYKYKHKPVSNGMFLVSERENWLV